jgi:phosphate transport system substrate-binding protein
MSKFLRSAVLALSLCFLSITTVSAAQIAVWGSTTCQKRFLEPGAEAFNQATGDTVKAYGVGTGKGLLALLQGKAKVSAASEDLSGALKSAQKVAAKNGQQLQVPGNLVYHEIARDIIVPIVHKSNPITSLTWQQLADLNTGKVENWKEIGGPDLPVVVITSHTGSATRAVFQKQVMKKADYVATAKTVQSTRLEIQQVTNDPGAIGAVSKAFYEQNSAGVHPVQTDEISRPLGLITIGQPTPEVQSLIDFFKSPEGQKFIQ